MTERKREVKRDLIKSLDPLEVWLRRMSWVCLISWILLFVLAPLSGVSGSNSTLVQEIGVASGVVGLLTLIPAVLWLKYGRKYLKNKFDEKIARLEQR